jgi:hypothetical protein
MKNTALMEGVRALMERYSRQKISLCYVRIHQEGIPLASQEEGLYQLLSQLAS